MGMPISLAIIANRGSAVGGDGLVDAMYAGPKATLRPFHDRVIELARSFGPDVELAPKQAYVEPAPCGADSRTMSARDRRRVGSEIGLNLAGVPPVGRLEPAGGMCTHRVRLSSTDELDAEMVGWLREAYERASTGAK